MPCNPAQATAMPLKRLFLLPVSLAMVALATDWLPAKMGVPLACALILLLAWQRTRVRQAGGTGAVILCVVAAFVCSAAGDYFLSNMSAQPAYFVIGIALYLLAHLGYLGYGWCSGRLNRRWLTVLLLVYLPYGLLVLKPAIADPLLLLAVMGYLLVSCLVLAVAGGSTLSKPARGLFTLGIGLIVASDTIISFTEFLQFRALDWLILPTYYLAHLCITCAVLSLLAHQPSASPPAARERMPDTGIPHDDAAES